MPLKFVLDIQISFEKSSSTSQCFDFTYKSNIKIAKVFAINKIIAAITVKIIIDSIYVNF